MNYSYKQSPRCVLLNGCSESSRESLQIFEVHSISVKIHAAENAEVYLEPCQIFKPLTANPQNGQTHSNNLSATANELLECV